MRYVYNGDDPQHPSLTVYQPAEPEKKVLTAWLFLFGYGSYKTSNISLSIMMVNQKQQFIYEGCRYSVSDDEDTLYKLIKAYPHAKESSTLCWFFLLKEKIAPFLESIKNGFKNEKDAYEFLSRTSDDFALPEIWLHLLNYSYTVSRDHDCMLFLSNYLDFFLERYGVEFTRRLIQPFVNYEYVDYYSGKKTTLFGWQHKMLGLEGLTIATPKALDDEDHIYSISEILQYHYHNLKEKIHRQLPCEPRLLFQLPISDDSGDEKKAYSNFFKSVSFSEKGLQLSVQGSADEVYDGLSFYRDVWQLKSIYIAEPKEFNDSLYSNRSFELTVLIEPEDVCQAIDNMMVQFYDQLDVNLRQSVCQNYGLPITLWDTILYPTALSGYLSAYRSEIDLAAFDSYGLTLLHKFALNFAKSPITFYYPENYYTLFNYGSLVCFDQYLKYTPLHLLFIKCEEANLNGQPSTHIAEILITKVTNFQELDYQGNNYLHGAVASHMPLKMIRELVEKGVPFDVKNNAGLRPVDIARDKGRQDVVDYLSNELPNRIMLAKPIEQNIQVQLTTIMKQLEQLSTQVSGRFDRLETRVGHIEARVSQFQSQTRADGGETTPGVTSKHVGKLN